MMIQVEKKLVAAALARQAHEPVGTIQALEGSKDSLEQLRAENLTKFVDSLLRAHQPDRHTRAS